MACCCSCSGAVAMICMMAAATTEARSRAQTDRPPPQSIGGVTRWWVSVVAYEAALVISDLASEAGTSGAGPFFDGPVERFWRDFWRVAPDCSLARRVTD